MGVVPFVLFGRTARLWAIVLSACLLVALDGCGALRRMQVFPVLIVNDTGAPVVVRGCASFCSSSLLTFDLQPGASVVVNRTTNMHKRFSVTTPTGGHIGCVDLYFRTPQPDAQVPVSRATPCLSGSRLPWRQVGLVLFVGLVLALVVLLVLRRLAR